MTIFLLYYLVYKVSLTISIEPLHVVKNQFCACKFGLIKFRILFNFFLVYTAMWLITFVQVDMVEQSANGGPYNSKLGGRGDFEELTPGNSRQPPATTYTTDGGTRQGATEP